jgi:hypothetical protein
MPTLLEALEEKYGYAQTSDIEAEPELLMLRLPKRTPRQRFDFQLSFIATSFFFAVLRWLLIANLA